jgi:hypothetical protein
MGDRFAVAKLSVSMVAVLVWIVSAGVAVMAWRSSSETARSQLALSRQVYEHSRPVLSGEGGIGITSAEGMCLYDWWEGDKTAPSVISIAEWKHDKIFAMARLSNTGGQAALLANYGLAYARDSWIPASASDALCKVQAFLPWKPCDQDGQLLQPGQILFIEFDLTQAMIRAVPDSFRKNIQISYEAGAYDLRDVVLPIPIPRRAVLGY